MAGFYRIGGSFYRNDRDRALPEGAVAVERLPRAGERWDEAAGKLVADQEHKERRRRERRRRDPEAFAELEGRVDRLEAALRAAGIEIAE